MPVTLKIEDKSQPATKGRKKEPGPLQQAINSARVPQDQQMGWVALGLWIAALLAICAVWQLSEATAPTFGIGMPIWCAVTILAYVIYGPSFLMKKLRERGSNAVVSSSNKPALKNLLGKAAPLIAAKEPPALIDDASTDPRARIWPNALVFNKALFGIVDDNEASVLAVRGLAHQKLGHGRRLGILDLVNKTQPPATKLLVWPVVIYAKLLENLWLPHANRSADRLALLLIRNQLIMLSAILKEYAANDPEMIRMEVSSADVTNWIQQKGHIGMAGKEISTQYKLGRAIHEAPVLEDRLHELQMWGESATFKEAIEKMAVHKK